jgi:hypothetical protein
VQCPESSKLVKVIRGLWWEIVARNEATVKEETVVVSIHTSVTAWTREAVYFTVDTPAKVQK